MSPPRVALVTNVLSHYRTAGFDRLRGLLGDEITFFLMTERMEHRSYVLAAEGGRADVVALKGWRWRREPEDDVHLNDIRPVLRGGYGDLILGAWDEPTCLLLWLWARARGVRVHFWVESTAEDSPRGWLKEAVKRRLLAGARGCIVPGRRARDYCLSLGMPAGRVFLAPNAGDTPFWRAASRELLPRREDLRRQAGLDGMVVLFAGRLVESIKGVSALIKACGLLETRGLAVRLVLAGDGPDRRAYEALAGREGPRRRLFLGTLKREELCRQYAMADVLVLPSRREAWGFVLNEGMEFGLPVVVSDNVGAGPELVRPGVNGAVVPPGDAQALAAALEPLARDPPLRARMGRASAELVGAFTPEQWAAGVAAALGAERSNGRRPGPAGQAAEAA